MRKDPIKARAQAEGCITYEGAPCKYGHAPIRYTKSGCCVECGRLATAKFGKSEKAKAYRKQWRAQPNVRARERAYAVWFSKYYRYGLSRGQFEALQKRANGKCEACSREF